jgi:hypothetical protein
VRDATGVLVPTSRDAVTLAISANPGSGTLSGTRTVNAVNGIASFAGLSIDQTAVGYTLRASSGSLTAATSAPFCVSPVGKAVVLANSSYVDYIPGNSNSEASNVEASLKSTPDLSVEPFVDISALGIQCATREAAILAIPEQFGTLTADLSTDARSAIVGFVEGGGTLMVFLSGSSNSLTLVNTLFGYSVAGGTNTGPWDLNATAAAGTPFAGGPAAVPSLSATNTVSEASLPAGFKSMYTNVTTASSAVAVLTRGSGRIILFAWDWFNAAPTGTADGGWVDVLRRATTY